MGISGHIAVRMGNLHHIAKSLLRTLHQRNHAVTRRQDRSSLPRNQVNALVHCHNLVERIHLHPDRSPDLRELQPVYRNPHRRKSAGATLCRREDLLEVVVDAVHHSGQCRGFLFGVFHYILIPDGVACEHEESEILRVS